MIDRFLSPAQAGALVRRWEANLVHQDHIPADRALRMVCERVADGDPMLLAAPGQIWQRRPAALPDDAPERLTITGRLSCPPRALVRDVNGGEESEMPIATLASYDLVAWQDPTSTLPPGVQKPKIN